MHTGLVWNSETCSLSPDKKSKFRQETGFACYGMAGVFFVFWL